MSETVKKLAVVGAGTMGRGIALIAAAAGIDTTLADVSPGQLDSARGWITDRLARGDEPPGGAGAVAYETDAVAAAAGADAVIEAVVEDLQVKRALMADISAANPTALLASNTSALSVTAIFAGITAPERGVGMHFFSPAHRMKLCEVVVGVQTADTTRDTARELARQLGKEPITVLDSPGFVASRLNCALGNEALRMLAEGVATAEEIDAAARLGLNHPMGPLELLDMVGLDVRLAALETLHAAYGEHFRPTPLHRRLVAAGRLGNKAGGGVHVKRPAKD
jgi:3-hydroxybutyryl-CoA dehydrogenase